MNRVEKLLSFPYHKRQFIYIVDDYKGLESKNWNFNDTADVVWNSVTETLHDTFNPLRIAENFEQGKWTKIPLLADLNLVQNVYGSIQQKNNEKDLTKDENWENEDIKPIVWDGSSKLLKFQVGHPLKDTVYVAHPVEKGIYFPFANYHRLTFEHKWAEAMRLLYNLGATEIYVVHKTGWSRDVAANMSVGIPIEGVTVDSSVKYDSKEKSTNDLIAKFFLPRNKSRKKPDNLVWFHHEETWKQVAEGRLEFELDDFSIELNYKEDYNVNASFSAKVLDQGLSLGGKFKNHESTSWILKGKFNSK